MLLNTRKKSILQITNITSVILTIIINALANILPINGKYTGELSDAIPNLFVPAGLTFSIWGVIYTLLIVFAIYQSRDLFKQTKISMPFLERIGFLFLGANLANILWILLWHYQQIIFSLVVMLLLLISLILIYEKLDIGKSKVTWSTKLFVHVPFSVYLGWITVATIANVTAVFVTVGVGDLFLGEITWAIFILGVTVLITYLVLLLRKDVAYALVIIWALIGIAIKRFGDDSIYGVQPAIGVTASLSAVIICIGIVLISSTSIDNIKHHLNFLKNN